LDSTYLFKVYDNPVFRNDPTAAPWSTWSILFPIVRRGSYGTAAVIVDLTETDYYYEGGREDEGFYRDYEHELARPEAMTRFLEYKTFALLHNSAFSRISSEPADFGSLISSSITEEPEDWRSTWSECDPVQGIQVGMPEQVIRTVSLTYERGWQYEVQNYVPCPCRCDVGLVSRDFEAYLEGTGSELFVSEYLARLDDYSFGYFEHFGPEFRSGGEDIHTPCASTPEQMSYNFFYSYSTFKTYDFYYKGNLHTSLSVDRGASYTGNHHDTETITYNTRTDGYGDGELRGVSGHTVFNCFGSFKNNYFFNDLFLYLTVGLTQVSYTNHISCLSPHVSCSSTNSDIVIVRSMHDSGGDIIDSLGVFTDLLPRVKKLLMNAVEQSFNNPDDSKRGLFFDGIRITKFNIAYAAEKLLKKRGKFIPGQLSL